MKKKIVLNLLLFSQQIIAHQNQGVVSNADLTVRTKETNFSICSKSIQNCHIQVSMSGCLNPPGSVTITNNSKIAAKNIGASSTNANFLNYIVQNNQCPSSLAPGASCSISFTTKTSIAFLATDVMVKGTNTTVTFFNMNSILCPSSPLIAVGSYGSPSNTRPLLVQSQNGGTTWTYPQSTNAPSYPDFPDFTAFSRFSGTSCGSSTCIAVGSGEDAFTRAPILAMTQDGGNTWTYPQIIPPVFTPTTTDPFTRGEFNSSSCSGTVCIAVGDFNFNSPLLAFTQNSGTTWAFPDSVTTPVFVPGDTNPYSSNGIFNSASCSGSTCIAVGQYDDINSILRPFLVLSQNSGTTWTYPDSTTSPTYVINPFGSNGLFSGASCSGSICVAVGAYNNVSNVQTPLLALSQNSGTTWSYPESISIPIFSPANTHPFVNGDFSSVNCSGTTCVAVGQYQDITAVSRPFLAVSQNSGASWSYPDSITSPTLTNPFSNGGFNSVSCLATNCVAVGQYEDTSAVLRPLMAISQNSGATWTYLDSISNPVLPSNPFDTNGLLSSVTCLANICITAGTYTDTSAGNRPLLALSLNLGVTWSYVDSVTSPIFTPVNTNPYVGGGRFFSTAIGNTPSWMHPKIKEQKQSSFIFKR